MSDAPQGCVVCGTAATPGARMSNVVVEGRALKLCRAHTATVVEAMPRTFEDLRALFVGTGAELDGSTRETPERRSPIQRRFADDRRFFPPRPEGRRRSSERRADDPAG